MLSSRDSSVEVDAFLDGIDIDFSTKPTSKISVLLSHETIEECYSESIPNIDLILGYKPTESRRLTYGFLLLSIFHYSINGAVSGDGEDLVNNITARKEFLDIVSHIYSLDSDLRIRSLRFHRCGTTSYIFRVSTEQYGPCALKLIQPPYMKNPAISAATENYMAVYGIHSKYTTVIHRSRPSWILMEFIEGVNLNEYISDLRPLSTRDQREYVDRLARVIKLVSNALCYYEKNRLYHGDLTPFNIMVITEDGDYPKDIKLIDFGPNYVLQDHILNRRIFMSAFSRTELFTAPEVARGDSFPSINSDLYSFGMIILDMLSPEPLRKDTIGLRLQEIWRHPKNLGLAQLIETLVDDDPPNRTCTLEPVNGSYYQHIEGVISNHLLLYDTIVISASRSLAADKVVLSSLRRLSGLNIFSEATEVLSAFWESQEIFNKIGRRDIFLFQKYAASKINSFCASVIFISFLLYTLLDVYVYSSGRAVGACDLGDLGINLSQCIPHRFVTGGLWENLPGRLVALTFGIVASSYYLNIFSLLSVPNGFGGLGRLTNFVLRVNSFSYFVPIMVAIVYDPKLWPWCSLFGTAFPALNNYLCLKMATRGHRSAMNVVSIESYHRSETEKFLVGYNEWWILMGGYCLGIGAVGICLQLNLIHDEWFYATVVVFINILKIYRNNCTKEAPDIYGNLARLFFYQWRVKEIEART